ncbi:hypothetical protein SNE40_001332 [Patella caerulea]|uniref:RRM domain-containing protein n=1 Tax=Patella caerulea TaxID=87958 RepID=A0AAN8KJ44_PATCE
MSSNRLRIMVSNLPWTVSSKQLRTYFSQFGRVRVATVPFDKKTGFPQPYGFVQFQNEIDHMAVLSQENHILENRKLIVKRSIEYNNRNSVSQDGDM